MSVLGDKVGLENTFCTIWPYGHFSDIVPVMWIQDFFTGSGSGSRFSFFMDPDLDPDLDPDPCFVNSNCNTLSQPKCTRQPCDVWPEKKNHFQHNTAFLGGPWCWIGHRRGITYHRFLIQPEISYTLFTLDPDPVFFLDPDPDPGCPKSWILYGSGSGSTSLIGVPALRVRSLWDSGCNHNFPNPTHHLSFVVIRPC